MVYYWKFEIVPNKEITIYAHNAKECDLLAKAWLKKQGIKEHTYKKGNSYCIKKDTPLDIVDKEKEHLKPWLEEEQN